MNLLFCPALRLMLSSTDLWTLYITVLHKRSSADLYSLIESNLLILNKTTLPEVLFTLFLLLGLVVGHVGCVAPLVIRMVTLNNIIILSLLNHLHLVNTSLAISSRSSSSDCSKTDISVISLALTTTCN